MAQIKPTLEILFLTILTCEDVSNQFTTCQGYLEKASGLANTRNLAKTIVFFNPYFTHNKAYGTDYESEQATKDLNQLPRMRSLLKRKLAGIHGTSSVNTKAGSHEQ